MIGLYLYIILGSITLMWYVEEYPMDEFGLFSVLGAIVTLPLCMTYFGIPHLYKEFKEWISQ